MTVNQSFELILTTPKTEMFPNYIMQICNGPHSLKPSAHQNLDFPGH